MEYRQCCPVIHHPPGFCGRSISWVWVWVWRLKLVCTPAGYVYLLFEDERSVAALLKACSQSPFHLEDSQEFYFQMASRKMRIKKVSDWK